MEERFSALGISPVRVEAATPADIGEDLRKAYCDPNAFRWQTPPELACSLSHLRMLELFLKTEDSFAAIFEDDAILSADLGAFLDAYEAAAPDIDLLHLETDYARLRLSPKPDLSLADIGLYQAFNTLRGSAGYIVSRRAARRILAGPEVLRLMTDQALFNPFERPCRELVVRQADPALVIQEDCIDRNAKGASDLDAHRLQRHDSNARNFGRRIVFNLADLLSRDLWQPVVKAWHEYGRGAARRIVAFKP